MNTFEEGIKKHVFDCLIRYWEEKGEKDCILHLSQEKEIAEKEKMFYNKMQSAYTWAKERNSNRVNGSLSVVYSWRVLDDMHFEDVVKYRKFF